jgi:predicted amidohydrolase YtcJ
VRTLLRVGAIHSLRRDGAVHRALAIDGDRITAVADDAHGLDALADAATRVIDDARLTALPSLYDTHCHLRELVRNIALLDVGSAQTLADYLALVAGEAGRAPSGAWVQTSNAWHERNLTEQRLPTARELDAVTGDHPFFSRRGGHLAIANSRALALAGFTAATPDPPGGRIGHDASGALDGMLEGFAVYALAKHVPPLSFDEQLEAVGRATRMLARTGLGAVRDPIVRAEDVALYRAARDRGLLHTRVRLMLQATPGRSLDAVLGQLDRLAALREDGDDLLRVWGLKLVMDGGIEGAALDAPYANEPSFRGHLNWDPPLFAAFVSEAVARGWKIGTHCVGDRAVRTVLDGYERALAEHPGLPASTLVLEHALLADGGERARAVRLGVHVTVQAPLLYALAAQAMVLWGPERTRAILPVRSWLDEGASLSAGTDYPIGRFEPLESIWGLVTRETQRHGAQGLEQAIDRASAIALYTRGGAVLDGESGSRGTLEVGRLADVVAFRADPFACATDVLRTLSPALVIVGGRIVHEDVT